MDKYKYVQMAAFNDALEKLAFRIPTILGGITSAAKGAGEALSKVKGSKALDMASGSGGVGGVVGGIGGAGVEGYRGYQQAKEQGADQAGAIQAAIGRAGKGALVGGIGGAALGAGGGALASRSAKATELAGKATGGKWNPLGALSRTSKRQVHGLTGYADTQQLRAMKGGAYDAVTENIDAAKALGEAAKKGDPKAIAKAKKEYARTYKGQQAAQKAEDMGLHSIPGYAKSFAKNPLETIRAGVGAEWHTAPWYMKAGMIASPVASVGGEMLTPSEQGSPGRAERAGKELASEAMFAAAPLPIGAGMLAAKGLGHLGQLAGRGTDKGLAAGQRALSARGSNQ